MSETTRLAAAARRLAQVFRTLLHASQPHEAIDASYGPMDGGGRTFPIASPPPDRDSGTIVAADLLRPPGQDASVHAALEPLLSQLRPALQDVDAASRSAPAADRVRAVYEDLLPLPVCHWQMATMVDPEWALTHEIGAHPMPSTRMIPYQTWGWYGVRPDAILDELELAAAFPHAEPAAADRGRLTLRRWMGEVQGWKNLDFAGERIRRRLEDAAPLLVELGLDDLARRCDESSLFAPVPALCFFAECLRRLENRDGMNAAQATENPTRQTPRRKKGKQDAASVAASSAAQRTGEGRGGESDRPEPLPPENPDPYPVRIEQSPDRPIPVVVIGGAVPKAEPADDLQVHVDDGETAVLLYLLEQHPRLRVQVDIGAGASLSRPTVGQALTTLRNKGLTHQPGGARKGDGLTDKGKKLAEHLRKQTKP